ncbi:hypothetical protein KIN20_024278 [Parelaphostrongylus tenuis]|uniref:Uncharacterized protein n=1 Tax=Parelaphostrongylus tenuis TaxID=148309 RepID=A0AAD5MT64_PARTN|nr:hypothetical protein KIN20_024278 [Parelaphostrongylus tenuis]
MQVLPQRNLATCSMTVSLSRLTLRDGDASSVKGDCELKVVHEKTVEFHDSKENKTLSASTVLKEKEASEPPRKRKKNTQVAD